MSPLFLFLFFPFRLFVSLQSGIEYCFWLPERSIHPSVWLVGRPPGPSTSLQRRRRRKMTQKNLIASRPTSPESLVVCCCCCCNRVCAVARNVIEKQTNKQFSSTFCTAGNVKQEKTKKKKKNPRPFRRSSISTKVLLRLCTYARTADGRGRSASRRIESVAGHFWLLADVQCWLSLRLCVRARVCVKCLSACVWSHKRIVPRFLNSFEFL